MSEVKSVVDLERLPSAANIINQEKEKAEQREVIPSRMADILLDSDGKLAVKGKGKYGILNSGHDDLAEEMGIHRKTFSETFDCEDRAYFFRKYWKKIRNEKKATICLKNGNVEKISPQQLLHVSKSKALDRILNAISDGIPDDEIRVVEMGDRKMEMYLISPNLTSDLQEDDIVAFGVFVKFENKGGLRIEGAGYRLACQNGEVRIVHKGNSRRLKRPRSGKGGEKIFWKKVEQQARDAWLSWEDHAKELRRLPDISFDLDRANNLVVELSQKPFFIPQKITTRVIAQLENETGDEDAATFYDFWNALTHVGSHDGEISPLHSSRLRFAAGEITRRDSRFCSQCHRLLLS